MDRLGSGPSIPDGVVGTPRADGPIQPPPQAPQLVIRTWPEAGAPPVTYHSADFLRTSTYAPTSVEGLVFPLPNLPCVNEVHVQFFHAAGEVGGVKGEVGGVEGEVEGVEGEVGGAGRGGGVEGEVGWTGMCGWGEVGDGEEWRELLREHAASGQLKGPSATGGQDAVSCVSYGEGSAQP